LRGPYFTLLYLLLIVLRLLVIHVDVNADSCDNEQDAEELNPIVIHTAGEVADDEDDCAKNSADDTVIEFHCDVCFFVVFCSLSVPILRNDSTK